MDKRWWQSPCLWFLLKKSTTSVCQGAASPRPKDTKHRANHSDAVIYLSIHTHVHRANHSIAILLECTSERADLPNSEKDFLSLANTTSSATNTVRCAPWIKSMGAHAGPLKWPQVNSTFWGYPRRKGWAVQYLHMSGYIENAQIFVLIAKCKKNGKSDNQRFVWILIDTVAPYY